MSSRPSYLAVLRMPYAARTFGVALIGRLSYGVVFLSLILAVTHATGSYTVAGTFSALYGLTSSLLAPVRARLIDRRGLRRTLTPMATAYALLLAAIATATNGQLGHAFPMTAGQRSVVVAWSCRLR